jgi:DNA polymerase-3 subunit delta
MAVLKYNEIEYHLRGLAAKNSSSLYPAYLLYGEELLVKKALKSILGIVTPDANQQHGYEAWDGSPENIIEAIRQLNTYALLGDSKVVALLDTPLFSQGQQKKASKNRSDSSMPAIDSVSAMLSNAVTDGFPNRHYLIITTDSVDKRRRLFKTMEKSGLVVDCSVPLGDRQADKVAQDAVVRNIMQELLSQSGKSMQPAAYAAVSEMTGFDLRTFRNNLNKLIDFVGERKQITVEDVTTVLERSRQDPIYMFTNALGDRNLGDTLFYMDSLLANGYHELQLMAAAINFMRRLLVIKAFADGHAREVGPMDISYNLFRDRVMPLVQSHDEELKAQLVAWEQALFNSVESEPPSKRIGSDLLIAPNPKNAYPVYKLFQKALVFYKEELLGALKTLNQTDILLKSSGQPPRSLLANAVLKICSGTDRTQESH